MEKSLENPPSALQAHFLTDLEKAQKAEEKIRVCLDYMKQQLSQEETPQFRAFWEARSRCLDLFKEKISPRVRTLYWTEFLSLSEEIRKVKEILDQQSSFAAEQIELAIASLKKDLTQIDVLLAEMDPIAVPSQAPSLQKNLGFYIESQRKLDLLGTFAGRLNSLRKELIRTPMRIRHKNRLFEELSKLGDSVFPKRKEAVTTLSERFAADIEAFKPDLNHTFDAKEEIKALQAFAKVIAIHTKTFSMTREKLSGLWDEIRGKEKELQVLKAKKRDEYRESLEKIAPQIDLLKQECLEEKLGYEKAQEREAEILEEMRQLQLGRDEVKTLKKRLALALEPLEKKHLAELEKEKEREAYKQKQREKDQNALLEKLSQLLDRAESLTLDALVEKWEALVKEEKTLCPNGLDRERIRSKLDAVYDHIQEKQWHALQDDQSEEGIGQLHALLDSRHKARRKLKEALESHRKKVGGSGLNLEESLLYQEMIGEEKLRLDAIETMIEELEEKLFDVEE